MQIGVLLPQNHKWVLPAICCTAADYKPCSARAHGPLRAHDADRCLYANEMCSNQGWHLWGRARFPEHMRKCWCPAMRMPLSTALIREHGIRFGAERGEAVPTAVVQMRWEMICLMWGGSVFQLLFWVQRGLRCSAVCCFSLKVICSIPAINTSVPRAGDCRDVHWCTMSTKQESNRFDSGPLCFFVKRAAIKTFISIQTPLSQSTTAKSEWFSVNRTHAQSLWSLRYTYQNVWWKQTYKNNTAAKIMAIMGPNTSATSGHMHLTTC